MTLREKQALFAFHVAGLIRRIFESGKSCTFGETYRFPHQAAANAVSGIGIKNSLHCDRLAIDLNLFDSAGKYLTSTEAHREFGEWWERQHPLARWGGRFAKPDGNHYSFEHQGRK